MNIIGYYCFLFPFLAAIVYIITLFCYPKYNNSGNFNEGVSILIPCYNEEKSIFKQLSILCNMNYDKVEIICVNDCSTDNTPEILKYFEKKYNNVKIINNNVNLGKAKG